MDVESDRHLILYINNVLVKSRTLSKYDNMGTLSIVRYKSDPGDCIEWHQCDVSIEDDQEWAIVRGCENGSSNGPTTNSKTPTVQIPLKALVSFKADENLKEITLYEEEVGPTTFYFQTDEFNSFFNFLLKNLNTSDHPRHGNMYIVDKKEVQALEMSFAELDLFSEDTTKQDAVWDFLKKLHNPYETTMNAFVKVTDAILYKQHRSDTVAVAELLNHSFSVEEISDINDKISTEDYELISKALPLPPRTLPIRFPPLTEQQWGYFFDDCGRITDPNTIKQIIFHGGISPGDLRSEVWKFLLGYYPWNSTFEERELIRKKKTEEYFTMKLQWKTMSSKQEDNFMSYKEKKSLIEKDVYRTDRNKAYFSGDNEPNLEVLRDILMTYLMYNFDLGYVQGMSDLLSPLLVQLKNEVDTFWCFEGFMNKVKSNFYMDQAGMKKQLQQLYRLLRCVEPELANYLKHHESHNMIFCFRWLLILFKREFSFEDIYILWEVLWTEALCKNFHLLICAAILDSEKEILMSNNNGFTEILKHINELAERINLEQILRKAEGIYIQLSTAAKVPSAVREMIGLEPLPESDHSENENENENENKNNKKESENENEDSFNEICKNQKDTSMSLNGIFDQNAAGDPTELAFENSISLQHL